jgi:hypothetical protein
MQKFIVRKCFGGKVVSKVIEGQKHPAAIANFGNDAHGEFAYSCFVRGLMANLGDFPSTLFDEDSGRYIVGDVGQLAGAE